MSIPAGPGRLRGSSALSQAGRCVAILVTHGDVDHIGGVAELAQTTGAPVHMSAGERELLERPSDELTPGLAITIPPHVPEVVLRGDEVLQLGGIEFQTLRVPGHTADHLAFAAEGCLFSGDVLFAGSIGRYDRPGASWEALLDSIRMLVKTLPPETIVYPGHGPSTTLGREVETNPFLAELRTSAR